MKDKKEYGFTLIEVIVVISLLAIITFISLPTLESSYRRIHAMTLGRRVINVLNQARKNAIREGIPYSIYFESSGEYMIVSQSEEIKGRLSGVRISPSSKVTFYPNGTADSGKIFIYRFEGEEVRPYYEIRIQEVSGRIQLERKF